MIQIISISLFYLLLCLLVMAGVKYSFENSGKNIFKNKS